MPRRRRIALIGDILHVMARGLDGQPIFSDDADRDAFLQILGRNLARATCTCYAWALMPNHYHLVLRPMDQDAGMLMRRLNGAYARYFNRRNKRQGYLFQDRYKSLATRDFSYFRELVRYVHLNPLRSGLVKNLDALARYQWTGHGAVMGGTDRPWQSVGDLLVRFGRTVPQARAVYQRFLEKGVSAESGKGPLAAAGFVSGSTTGKDEWIDDRVIGEAGRVRESINRVEREQTARKQRMRKRHSLDVIAGKTAAVYGIDVTGLQCRGRRNQSSMARSAFCHEARMVHGYMLYEIGAYLGISATAVASATRRFRNE